MFDEDSHTYGVEIPIGEGGTRQLYVGVSHEESGCKQRRGDQAAQTLFYVAFNFMHAHLESGSLQALLDSDTDSTTVIMYNDHALLIELRGGSQYTNDPQFTDLCMEAFRAARVQAEAVMKLDAHKGKDVANTLGDDTFEVKLMLELLNVPRIVFLTVKQGSVDTVARRLAAVQLLLALHNLLITDLDTLTLTSLQRIADFSDWRYEQPVLLNNSTEVTVVIGSGAQQRLIEGDEAKGFAGYFTRIVDEAVNPRPKRRRPV
jgi:hypothetical protein